MSESNNPSHPTGPNQLDQAITHRCDWTETQPSLAVIEAITVAANRQPLEGPPLYDAIDSEALDTLFDGSEERPPAQLEVTFTYDGFDVTVSGAGQVTVRPADGTEFPD
jgi:hypothetical protein